jgi:hypothetical protein
MIGTVVGSMRNVLEQERGIVRKSIENQSLFESVDNEMPSVLFKPFGRQDLLFIKCGASGKVIFGIRECHQRAKQAILNNSSEFCLIVEDGQLLARYDRNENGEAILTQGSPPP